jgi:predicted outer membrane repeat protein
MYYSGGGEDVAREWDIVTLSGLTGTRIGTMYKMKGLLVGALVLCGVVSAHAAGIFRVDAASTAATPDGQTWATAYPTIQAGTNASAGVGEVWVKAGVYTGTTSSEVLTMKGGVSVYGGFVGTETSRDERDWAVNTTIIDGQGVRRCVIFDRQGCAQLNGVTVCNGYASVGGGICAYNNGSLGSNHLMSVVNCVFSNNSAGNGGAVYCRVDAVSNRSFVSASSSLTFENCLFTGNSARQGSAIMNYAYASASGSLGSGGVYANSTASCRPTFDRCVFIGNSVYSSSYAILFQGSASADAGVYMEHCTFYSSSIGFGTAKSGTPGYNMTIHSEAAPVIDYSILWGGTSISGSGTGANTPYVDHSCVQGGYAGTGNISADPLFMAAPGDLHLQVASPCIGPRTEDDLGAYEYTGPKIVGGIVINNGASSTISPQVLLSLNGCRCPDRR